jgi:hypothetical protein
MLIGILILAALTVGAAVLLITTPADEPDPVASEPPESGYNGNDNGLDPGDIETLPGPGMEDPPPEENDNNENDNDNDNDEDPLPTINSVAITFAGSVLTDFSEDVGDRIQLAVRIDPAAAGQEANIDWFSSAPAIVDVVADDISGLTATTTHISRGQALITVTVTEPDGTEHTAQTYARTR